MTTGSRQTTKTAASLQGQTEKLKVKKKVKE